MSPLVNNYQSLAEPTVSVTSAHLVGYSAPKVVEQLATVGARFDEVRDERECRDEGKGRAEEHEEAPLHVPEEKGERRRPCARRKQKGARGHIIEWCM